MPAIVLLTVVAHSLLLERERGRRRRKNYFPSDMNPLCGEHYLVKPWKKSIFPEDRLNQLNQSFALKKRFKMVKTNNAFKKAVSECF